MKKIDSCVVAKCHRACIQLAGGTSYEHHGPGIQSDAPAGLSKV